MCVCTHTHAHAHTFGFCILEFFIKRIALLALDTPGDFWSFSQSEKKRTISFLIINIHVLEIVHVIIISKLVQKETDILFKFLYSSLKQNRMTFCSERE